MFLNLTALPGDGVGPEVTDEAVRVLETIAETFGHKLIVTRKPVGGAALLVSKDPLPAETLQACLASGAVLLGAVGGPRSIVSPAICGRRAGCCGCGANWGCLPICGRHCASPGWKTLLRCERTWYAAPTS